MFPLKPVWEWNIPPLPALNCSAEQTGLFELTGEWNANINMLAACYQGGRSSPTNSGSGYEVAAAPSDLSGVEAREQVSSKIFLVLESTFTGELPPYPGQGHLTLARGPPPPPSMPAPGASQTPAPDMSKCCGVVMLLVFVLVFIGIVYLFILIILAFS